MNRIIDITTTQQSFPEGTVAGGVLVTISGPSQVDPQTLHAAPYSFTVPAGLAAGDYTVTAQAIDEARVPLGAAVNTSFTVAPPVLVDVPQAIAVAVAA